MKKTLYFGFVAATLAACAHHLETPEQERAEIRESGSETGRAARETGRSAVHAVGETGEAIGHTAAGAAHGLVYGARELGQTVSGTQGSPEAEAREARAAERARENIGQAGRDVREAGGSTVRTGREAGSTVVHGAETGWQAGEHAVGATRRATGERPQGQQVQRGGGPRK
jgi:hypothetical protein